MRPVPRLALGAMPTLVVLVVMLALVPLPAPTPVAGTSGTSSAADGPQAQANVHVGDTLSQFFWSTNAGGSRVIRITLDFGQITFCTFAFAAEGWIGSNDLLYHTAHDEPNRGWTALTLPTTAGTHVGNTGLSFQLTANAYNAASVHQFVASGTETLYVVAVNPATITNFGPHDHALAIEFTCDDPFTVDRIEGGRGIGGFVTHAMTGGAGANAYTAQTNVLDSFGAQRSQPNVHFRYHSDDRAAFHRLDVTGPGGYGASWMQLGSLDARLDGPAGWWDVDVTRSADARQDAIGVILGTADVTSLDAAAAV